ncbi:MAG: AAA family ATPase, partial [Firmicutes bacterium]|nr:AAA family ATPase [Bacillota bacterium]
EADIASGSIRMWAVAESAAAVELAVEDSELSANSEFMPDFPAGGALFSAFTDAQLVSLGIPEGALSLLRTIDTSDDLDDMISEFSPDVGLALHCLSTGDPYEDVAQFLEQERAERAWDLDDDVLDDQHGKEVSTFARAMLSGNASASIRVLQSDEDLTAILDQPLERWRIFLHPLQKSLVDSDFRGPVRVLGGAGTGKTVVAMHRARRLARERLQSGERLLFTTFSVNLAESIRDTLSTLCTKEEMERIDVVSIDRLAKRVLDQTGTSLRILYEDSELESTWREALSRCGQGFDHLPLVRDEYRRVIQQNGITTWEEYRDVSRTGRTVRISRTERLQVWRAVEAFRELMRDHHSVDGIDLFVWARTAVEAQPGLGGYRAAVVDEGQDLHPEAYRFLRALIPREENDLFIVGDAHQRIYARQAVLGRCGIHVRGQRSKRLRVNYRTTEQIRRQAMQVLTGLSFDDLDGGTDTGRDVSLLSGQAPERRHFTGLREEQRGICEEIRSLLTLGIRAQDIAVLARTKSLAESYEQALRQEGLSAVMIRRGGMTAEPGVRCGTMHGSKGLEFRVVFLASVNEGLIPPLRQDWNELGQEERDDVERMERSLLYVAATRARERLYVYSCGAEASRFWK